MTLVVGFVGRDGAVMASDSQATELDGTRYEIEKIWLARPGVLLGYSGNDVVRQPLRRAIEALLSQAGQGVMPRVQVEELICRAHTAVVPVLFARYVPAYPGDNPLRALSGSLLVLGHDDEGYYFFDVDGQNNVTHQLVRGFHTIGSGSDAAQVARALLENYDPQGRPVRQLRLLAYRTVDTCISVSAQYLAAPVQLWSSEQGGPFVRATDAELQVTDSEVRDWLTVERESLPTSLGEAPQGGPDMPTPLD